MILEKGVISFLITNPYGDVVEW